MHVKVVLEQNNEVGGFRIHASWTPHYLCQADTLEEALDVLRSALASYLRSKESEVSRKDNDDNPELILWYKVPRESCNKVVLGLQKDGWTILRQHAHHLRMYRPGD